MNKSKSRAGNCAVQIVCAAVKFQAQTRRPIFLRENPGDFFRPGGEIRLREIRFQAQARAAISAQRQKTSCGAVFPLQNAAEKLAQQFINRRQRRFLFPWLAR